MLAFTPRKCVKFVDFVTNAQTQINDYLRRLQTIAHCDLVAVLDHGECVECGSPLELLDRRPQSRFASMCGLEVEEIRDLATATS